MMSRNSMESSTPVTDYDDHEHNDHHHEAVGGRCLRRRRLDSFGSSELATVDDDSSAAGRWNSANIYENYEVVAAELESAPYGKLRVKCEENIYENICEDCGRLYGAGRCGFCTVEDESDRGSVASSVGSAGRKFHRKYSAKFQEFLGNFRIWAAPRVEIGRSKLSKSDIVHNVRGFEDVFRTNKSFDLGEICRMRDEEQRDQQLIEPEVGKDEVEEEEYNKPLLNDSSSLEVTSGHGGKLNSTSSSGGLKVKSLSANLIDLSCDVIYENLTRAPPIGDEENDDADELGSICDDEAVNHWMTTLRTRVEIYDDLDGDQEEWQQQQKRGAWEEYYVKSIPSVTFNDAGGLLYGGFGRANHPASISKLREDDLSCLVAEFRQNWQNNQRRRLRLRNSNEDPIAADPPILITFGSVEFESDVELSSSAGGTLTPGSLEELALSEERVQEKIEEKKEELVISRSSLSLNKHRPSNSAVCDELRRRRRRLQKYLLDVSLCRVALTYERWLKVFLEVTVGRPSRGFNRRRHWYRLVMTNRGGVDSTGSALQDSVRIDQYFQFLEANETMLNRLEDFRRRRRRKGELHPLPDADVQSNSSSTSGVHSDLDSEQNTGNNIYQHIWTCKTEPNPEPVYEEAPAEHIYEYIRLEPPRDDSEWEVVDDFAFSKQQPPPVPNRNIRHPLDHYRNVCILYHPGDPRINRIVYNYRRDYIFDYREEDLDTTASSSEESNSSFCSSCVESSDEEDDDEDLRDKPAVPSSATTTTTVSYSIPDCVQYWKFMLLNVNYNDDEEDVIMTEKTIAVIADNVDNKSVQPVEPANPATSDSSPSEVPTPPVPIASQLHSPKFFGPAVIRSPSKSQIPASDSPVGTYKSNENLADVPAPPAPAPAPPSLDKEKSPTPKRERLRDKMKAVLPLSSSWSSSGSGNQDDGLVFGVELDQVERDEKLQVPRFVTEVVEILKEPEFIETSGLYRASGNKNSIEGIKKKLNEKRSPKKYEFLKKQDVHSLTGSLKLFFRELKSPLIPRDVYEMCVQKTKDEAQTIENIKYSLEKMELINRNTLRYLIRHLRCVHQNSDVNMMNSSNLAIVWGACLFASTLGLMESYENNDLGRINTLVRQLIDHYDKIFYSERRID